MCKSEATIPDSAEPAAASVLPSDAVFLLRKLPQIPPTHGGIRKSFLHCACPFALEAPIIGNTHIKGPSICEHGQAVHGDHQTT